MRFTMYESKLHATVKGKAVEDRFKDVTLQKKVTIYLKKKKKPCCGISGTKQVRIKIQYFL